MESLNFIAFFWIIVPVRDFNGIKYRQNDTSTRDNERKVTINNFTRLNGVIVKWIFNARQT